MTNGMPRRHADRLAGAVATMKPAMEPGKLRIVQHADGRRAFPVVVQYRLKRYDPATGAYVESPDPADLLDLPPTGTSHPDPRALADGGQPSSLPYVVVVHQPAAYDRLRAAGWLDTGHRTALCGASPAMDNRSAPGV